MENEIYELSGGWLIAVDGENNGKEKGYFSKVADGAIAAKVPSVVQQFYPGYHGAAWMWCRFTPELTKKERTLLRFGGVDYKAEVWLNGEYLGEHEGAEDAFTFDASNAVKPKSENLLAVRIVTPGDDFTDGLTVNNCPQRNKRVKKRAGSHIAHGGIWYGVSLLAVPDTYLADAYLIGDVGSGKITAEITLDSTVAAVGELRIEVSERNEVGAKVAEKREKISVKEGLAMVRTELVVPNRKLWDVDEPNLYNVGISVITPSGENKKNQKFGFREFKLKDGYFYLNGKKIFLKCAHSGNAFPIGLMLPERVEQARQDFIYAKAAGFNMLRGIAGLFRPEQIDIADEIGMLVYDECFASWSLGHSAIDRWLGEEQFAEMQTRHPDQPLGEEKPMLERWKKVTEQMLMRDRSHPSVVVWGLLNETFYNDVFLTAVDFLPRVRELDKSRLVLLNAGRFDYDRSIGSSSNPFTDSWEKQLGVTELDDIGDVEPVLVMGDNHYYPTVPIEDESVAIMRNMGAKYRPVFLSEAGVGSQFDVIEEYKHFVQYGQRCDLDDSGWLKKQSEDFTKDFYRLGMDKVYSFPESLLKASQAMNAEDRKRFFDIVRSNPNYNGFSLTGLLDHGMCGEGLWSYWRWWKPGMFDVVSEGWAKLRWCLFATENVYAGEQAEFECVLATDGVLASGEYHAHFTVSRDGEIVERFDASFNLCGDDFATPVVKRKITASAGSGKYEIEAMLDEGSPVANTVYFYAYDKPNKTQKRVCGVGIDAEFIKKRTDEADGFIVVGKVESAEVRELLAAANEGAIVAFLDGETLENADNLTELRKVLPDLRIENHRDWLYHKEYILADKQVFKGLGDKMMELTRFKGTFPHKSIHTAITPDDVICPGILTGFYGVDGAYESFFGALGVRVGRGRVILSTFEILDKLGSPVAATLLNNLIEKFA